MTASDWCLLARTEFDWSTHFLVQYWHDPEKSNPHGALPKVSDLRYCV